MITRIRRQSKKLLQPIAKLFVKSGVTANTITIAGLFLSFLYLLVIFIYKNPLLGILLISFSAFMDALDGEVARLTRTAGVKGSFIDSSLDRIEDINYLLGLLVLGFSPLIVSLLIGLSLVIPYLRAKGESLGLTKIEGRGIIERGERIIFIIVTLFLGFFSFKIAFIFLIIFCLLSAITVIQRFYYIYRSLP
ncbi:archaetidylinositol phosphate synthase [Stygiolobus caldivivus]|uniref:Archaetidylinositol phosphate synthase n=1 Tax=Stygiolobus caldivivus TaxID=2824673 RepID=A0A8D5ZK38_9CREN|nr:archaetidylinositol phosphate synthase [Stygiolobus caldivivus]BCU71326.1 CDP-alcohol phosphatidyltransferase [Stygiolobus caldivivus]